ncbi:MAG: hypothetical protein IH969_00595, partial [Candidatus Krumholzibacteriota bacterium]|nr:hypothetical protein [Candidatus Krumholzibacteriota bacterium]
MSGTIWKPKSSELRRIDVKEELVNFLWKERERQQEENLLKTFVVPNRRMDKPVNKDALQKAFRKMVDREEELVDTITLHALRH